jgi:tungstate transport system substrate-binding protein
VRRAVTRLLLAVSLGVIFAAAGCSRPAAESITLGTTTSAQDSGVLDMLVPKFKAETGIEVKVIAVGSGQALELGRRGDADILLVHDPAGEQRFMATGQGSRRAALMANDFVLVGPANDPANVKGASSIAEAFQRIAQTKSSFVSRGDESGTHHKERIIWKQAGIEPAGDWYIRAGTGMGQVLRMASQKHAYTLSDRGTFLAQKQGLELAVLREGDAILENPYSIILVNPANHPGVHAQPAERFADFLLSPAVQKAIGEFGVDHLGQPLFQPRAGKPPAGSMPAN